ncbi:probable disease resistance protein At4g27220 [Mangifera indica]|uniref:probable disease resistance protein At4g27220 n=1 Tax=Mangifera indica TaxID=29780 RepID=UPI001CFC0E2A|nr:probable disease resistance protein At4g27220 [Mangifera indica]
MEIVSAIAGKIAEYLSVAAGGQLGYLFHYNDNIKDLKERVKELSGCKERVQMKIATAKRNGESVFIDVQDWIEKVDKISAEAEKFFEDEAKTNKRCLKGWCINLGQRYRFSKKAKEQALAISYLVLQEVERFEHVSSLPSPSAVVSSSSVIPSGTFESRNSLKKQILKTLIDDDNISIIGICGMGGVGKTTLVKEISRQVREEKIYEEVVVAVVSQNPSIMKIQGNIADTLGVAMPLWANSESVRASFLRDRIKEKKQILVILDDVWKRIEFDEIGIPWSDHRGCKILITSRSIAVCNQMRCQKNYTVETLSEQESWDLFSKIVGLTIENYDINQIAGEVIAKCGGLPIAIVTIAGALKGKDKRVWSNAARQLKTSILTSIPGMESNVISSLELSFNCLENDEIKSLFLFCSLFPEDYKIPVESLVRYWIGLKWFGDADETIEGVRNRVHAIVSDVTYSFLLIDDGKNCVKMHNIVRDFALTVASKYGHKFIVKAGTHLQEWPDGDTFDEFTCISLMANFIRELPSGLKCPNLQVLLLQGNKNLVIPDYFFQEMKDLKVLDLGKSFITSLPDSLSFLINLRTLDITNCDLGNLSVIGKLTKLEILNLSNSYIKEIPISFSQLSNLRLLDVNNCWLLELITPGVIQSLKKLEELYINVFQNWKSESENLRSNASLVELQALSRLTNLHIYIPNLDLLPKFLSFQNLFNFILQIGGDLDVQGYFDMSRYSRTLILQQINNPVMHEWVKGLLKRIEFLSVETIDNLESVSHNLVEEGFNELKSLDINSCEKIKCLLNTLELTPNSTFHNLEELHLYEIPNLVEMCKGEPPAEAFSKLKVLEVARCDKMLNVVPSQLLRKFQNLHTFIARNCESMVYTFDCEEIKITKGESKLLSSLEYLELYYLPEMSHIWNGDHQSISLQNLKKVEIGFCGKLTNLFSATLLQGLICLEDIFVQNCDELKEIFEKKEALGEELDPAITSPGLQNLTSIDIWDCEQLRSLFSPSIVKCLVKLKRLVVRRCSSIQEIIKNEKGEKEASIKRLLFPSLSNLELRYLENLSCFSSGPYAIEFPTLERLKIYRCENMKTFGYGEQVTPKLKEVILDGEKRWNGNINTTLQEFLNEKEFVGRQRKMRKKKKWDGVIEIEILLMVGLKMNFTAFSLIMLTVFLSVIASQGLGLVIGAAFMDVKKATTLASIVVMTFMLSGGFFIRNVPYFMRWVHYISFNYHSYRLLLKIQFSCSDSGPCDSSLIRKLRQYQGGSEVGALVAMIVGYWKQSLLPTIIAVEMTCVTRIQLKYSKRLSRRPLLKRTENCSHQGAKSEMMIRESLVLMMENAGSCLCSCILILWYKIWERNVGGDEPLIDKLSFDSQRLDLCGGEASEGVFVGALLSMSSPAVVLSQKLQTVIILQCVLETEKSGGRHTSAVSVPILPQADEMLNELKLIE